MKNIVVNSSMPRSGSELMQVILNQNPEIYGSCTSPVLGFCDGVRNHMETPEVKSQPPELMRSAMLSSCNGLIQGYYDSMTDKPNVVDKSRGWIGNYEFLQNILGEQPKVICMVRDLREVMVSQELKFRANQHLPLGAGSTLEERVANWLNETHIAFALKNLYEAETRGNSDDIGFVRYEDLTEHPETTMKWVYEYLGLDYYEHDFNNLVKTVEEDHSVHGIFGNHDVKKELKPQPNRYQEVLGRQISENIVNNNSWFYNKFYR